MEKLSFEKYKLPKPSKKPERKIEPWQQYAVDLCKEMDIKFPFNQIIFRQAKKNLEFLKGKVENTKEKFGEQGYKTKGRYLISLFRAKKPWEN